MKRLAVAVLAGLLLAAVAATSAAGPTALSQARAWSVWVKLPGQEVVLVAGTSAVAGGDPVATAVPVAVGGQANSSATADEVNGESVATMLPWADPTGSMSLDGGLSEARADAGSASARAAVGAGSGSGFALADELFSWEQQETLLNAWEDAVTALATALNEQLGLLEPVLGPRGLSLPPLDPPHAIGFVDVAGAKSLASTSEASVVAGSAIARASAQADAIQLLGGFIEIEGMTATAMTEHVGGDATDNMSATLGSIRLAGIEVAVDGGGLVLASQDVLSRAALAPVLAHVLTALDDAGVSLRIGEQRVVADVREISALELEWQTPAGPALLSLGHAEVVATAGPQPAGPAPPAVPPAPPPDDVPAPAVPPAASVDDPPVIRPPADEVVAPPTTTAPPPAALRLRPLGAEARRAIASTFLLLLGGVFGVALLVPTLIGRRMPAGRTQPILEVLP